MYEISEGRPVLDVHPKAESDDIPEALSEMIDHAQAAVVVLAAALGAESEPPSEHVVEKFLHLIQRHLELAAGLAAL